MASKLEEFAKVVAPGPKGPGAAPKAKPAGKVAKSMDGDMAAGDEIDVAPSKEEVAVAKELQSAFTKGDPTALAMALKNFIQECGYGR